MIFGITCEVPIVSSAVHVEHQECVDPPLLVFVFDTGLRAVLGHVEGLDCKPLRAVLFIKLVDFSVFILIGVFAAGGAANTVFVLVCNFKVFAQIGHIKTGYLEHQGRHLLPGLAGGTTLITVQLIGRPVIPSYSTTEVRQTGQTTGFRGVNENVTGDGELAVTPLCIPLDNAFVIPFDMAEANFSDVGRFPADAGDVVGVMNLDSAAVFGLCQIALQKVGHGIHAVMLPHLALPPVERTFGKKDFLTAVNFFPTNIKKVLSAHRADGAEAAAVAVVVHRIGHNEVNGCAGGVFCRLCGRGHTGHGGAVYYDCFCHT